VKKKRKFVVEKEKQRSEIRLDGPNTTTRDSKGSCVMLKGGGWVGSGRHTQRRCVTHTELSSDSVSIPLLAAQPSDVAVIIFVWRLNL